MNEIIEQLIDVRKLDESCYFEGKTNNEGHTPLYMKLALIPKKEVGKYGDPHFITQDIGPQKPLTGMNLLGVKPPLPHNIHVAPPTSVQIGEE